jgi:hypothetical protein
MAGRRTVVEVMAVVALGMAVGMVGAAKKPEYKPTSVEQAVIKKIKAADEKANCQIVRNVYCPITGKRVDPRVPPIDVPQKFHHVHLLFGVADPNAAETYRKARAARKSNKWAVTGPVAQAASNSMRVDLSNLKDIRLRAIEDDLDRSAETR